MYGAALTTGSTVADIPAAPEPAQGGDREQVRDAARRFSRRAPWGDRLSRPRKTQRARRRSREQILAATRCGLRGCLCVRRLGESKIEPIVSPGGIKAWLVRRDVGPDGLGRFRLPGARMRSGDKRGVATCLRALLR